MQHLEFSNLVHFWVLLNVNRCVFSPSVLLQVLTLCLSIRFFCYVLFLAIFYFKIVLFPRHPVVGMFSCNLPLFASRIFFSLFWDVLFCQYCFILFWNLFSLPSFARNFWFISPSWIVCFTCVAFSFLSPYVLAFFLCLIIFACCRRFLIIITVPSEFLPPVLDSSLSLKSE